MNKILPYIRIARPDHWFKNVFMIPGIVLAFFDTPGIIGWELIPLVFIAIVSVCLVASSNYVINEILDAPKDSFHPQKRFRPIPSGQVNLKVAYVEWLMLGAAGLILASLVNTGFFLSAAALFVMGLAYNIPPVRLKDLPYLDVLSESVNNPIRLLLGWYAVGSENVIMLSLVMSYWMLGAFLMAMKRYAEYSFINSAETASSYRKSFSHYNKNRLLTSIIYYSTAFGLFLGMFIMRYRIELIFSIPFIAGFIAYYLHIGFKENSPAQYPEKLYKIKPFMLYTAVCVLVIIALLFVDMPSIEHFFRSRR